MTEQTTQYSNNILQELNEYRFNRDLSKCRLLRTKLADNTRFADRLGKTILSLGLIPLAISLYAGSGTNNPEIYVGGAFFALSVLMPAANSLLDYERIRSSLKAELSGLEKRLYESKRANDG